MGLGTSSFEGPAGPARFIYDPRLGRFVAQPQITPEIQQQVMQLQQMSGALSQLASQRQQFEMMRSEAEQALEALQAAAENSPVWRSVGAVMVQETRAAAIERLQDDVETMAIRSKRTQAQEEEMRKQFEALQAKLQAVFKA